MIVFTRSSQRLAPNALILHRCLQRHGISRLPDVDGDNPAKKTFKAYPIGYFNIPCLAGDIAEVQTDLPPRKWSSLMYGF